MNSAWSTNDALFFKELKEGHNWQYLPATFFHLSGLQVEIPELRIRSSIQEAQKWKDSADLIVQGQLIEVKSRNERFITPESFPYSTIFIDTVSGYDAKKIKPLAYVMISRITGSMLAMRSTSNKGWMIESRWDHVRKIHDDFYVGSKNNLQTLDILVSYIKKVSNG